MHKAASNMSNSKSSKGKIGSAIRDNKKEFNALQLKLIDLMSDFSRIAVRMFQSAKGEPVTILEVNQIVSQEFETVKDILSDPKEIDLISKKIAQEYKIDY